MVAVVLERLLGLVVVRGGLFCTEDGLGGKTSTQAQVAVAGG